MKISETAEKIFLFMALVQRQLVNVEFDGRKGLVPAQFIERDSVVFQYGSPAVLVVPIPDLEVTEEGVRATLSFGRLPFQTFVPWSAVIAIFGDDGRGKVWNQEACQSIQPDARLRLDHAHGVCDEKTCQMCAKARSEERVGDNVIPLFGKKSS